MGKGKRKLRDGAELKELIVRQEARARREIQLWDSDPQKQYIRRYGWLEIIQDYQTRRRAIGIEKPLKYLTLPGPNYSDIGMLWKAGIVEKAADGTLNVAICDRDSAEYVFSYLDDLDDLDDNVGTILADGDRHLHQELEDSRGELHKSFPFDVINADFCDSLISEKRSQLNALTSIFGLQRGQRFLLLLTTKPNPDPPARLVEVMQHNISEIKEFRAAYIERYGSADLNKCLENPTFFAQLVFPKVIARIARRFAYRTYEHFVAKYTRVTPKGEYEMIAHSLEFEPLGRRKEELKYEPYFKRVPMNKGEEDLYIQLSPKLASQASQAYVEFIVQLLERDSIDVAAELQTNPAQETELRAEADSLIEWWESI